MRVKQIWVYFPLPSKAKLVWSRLTFSKLTTTYFIFSVLHCLVQLALQARAFTINANSARFLFDISLQANAFNNSVPYLADSQLCLCPDVPTALNFDTGKCVVVWNGAAAHNNVTTLDVGDRAAFQTSSVESSTSVSASASSASTSSVSPSSVSPSSSAVLSNTPSATKVAIVKTVTRVVQVPTTPTVQPASTIEEEDDGDEDEDDDDEDHVHVHKRQNWNLEISVAKQADALPQVNVSLLNQPDTVATLSSNCTWSLNYPVSVLDNTKREDVVFMTFQIWVLGMSLVALLNESIPHIIASLLTHAMATGWASYQIVNTRGFESDFARVITHGACNGVPQLLGGYWTARQDAEYASLALNVVALFVSAILSWKLFKTFGWQTFKRVGASFTINRIYKLVLVLSIALQLSFFFMGATVGLWIDSLINGLGLEHADHLTLYRATSFAAMFLLLPWIATGYIGVRRELRIPVIVFLLLSVLYLAAWSIMFLSNTFRWEFWSWRFFSLMATLSVALTVLAFILGIVCRLNFGKGLLRYLNAQEPLPGDDFTPVTFASDPEKVEFPSNQQPIPTFSAAFGKGNEVPVPSQMFPTQMGPRFFRSAQPFDSRSTTPIQAPSMAYTRSSSHSSGNSSPVDELGGTAVRSNTRTSNMSYHSVASYYQYSDDGHSRSGSMGKRWVIE
ncbi:hypothetical protein F5878DRAFT_627986 [Lentinula raphanica]|uniref:Uncharacterized protein n=1 Tax=Lentinula raphanica TaxID=153919 RepID=A0AA38P3J3_9AGAR|nr:hypothetical protein F5880DRAFT_1648007 [Lentinula raphanica]KAJ3835408.1 hypothetical protein F5878DRAFT_627986 [Lentinula raphanica]